MPPHRPRRRWLRWISWLIAAAFAATVAQYWQPPTGMGWATFAWLLPVAVAGSMAFTALWDLLGSRRSVAPARAAPRRNGRRKVPRDPKAQLHELRRYGDYWAITLRLPPEGACEVAEAVRGRVFDLYRAPALPLAGCANGRCACGYSGLKERRRRNVLPRSLDRDRRAGAVVAWPGAGRRATAQPPEHPSAATPFAEALRT